MTYESVHRMARTRLRKACERCGATTRLEAALRPTAPQSNLRLDEARRCWYSVSPADYGTLCVPCHRRMDWRIRSAPKRFRQRCESARRCTSGVDPPGYGCAGPLADGPPEVPLRRKRFMSELPN
jgi:hypothetical protein